MTAIQCTCCTYSGALLASRKLETEFITSATSNHADTAVCSAGEASGQEHDLTPAAFTLQEHDSNTVPMSRNGVVVVVGRPDCRSRFCAVTMLDIVVAAATADTSLRKEDLGSDAVARLEMDNAALEPQ